MENTVFWKQFETLVPEISIRYSEPMAAHTSFKIGGPAAAMAFPKDTDELSLLLKAAKKLQITPMVLGAGTNILAPDEGINALVICLKDCLGGMELLGNNQIRIFAGVTMARAAVFAANNGLGGMEFAHGIPGTVGGGVYMNAGAYGGEIGNICTQVQIMTMDGELRCYSCEQMQFSYRHSILEEESAIVVSADFRLEQKPVELIRAQMQDLMERRKTSQPLDKPSAGSAFKRPVGGYAAALIDQAGLKGFKIGDAAVSEKHAGFVVNLGQATAHDVKELLRVVAQRVKANSGIDIYPEIRIW